MNASMALCASAGSETHAPAGQLIQCRQCLRHHHRTTQPYDLRRAELQFFCRQTDRGEASDRVAHELDGLREKSHLVATLFCLLHERCNFSSIGKLTVT